MQCRSSRTTGYTQCSAEVIEQQAIRSAEVTKQQAIRSAKVEEQQAVSPWRIRSRSANLTFQRPSSAVAVYLSIYNILLLLQLSLCSCSSSSSFSSSTSFSSTTSYSSFSSLHPFLLLINSLVGLVDKASASRAEDPEFDSRLLCGNFSGSSQSSDLKIGTPVATLLGAWSYRVSAGTGRPGVSIL